MYTTVDFTVPAQQRAYLCRLYSVKRRIDYLQSNIWWEATFLYRLFRVPVYETALVDRGQLCGRTPTRGYWMRAHRTTHMATY